MQEIQACVEVLSLEEIQTIHRSSLRVLERVGFRVPDEDCLDHCARSGAIVDRISGTVKVPASLMEETLQTLRGVAEAVPVDRSVKPVTGVISTQLNLVESVTKTRRQIGRAHV